MWKVKPNSTPDSRANFSHSDLNSFIWRQLLWSHAYFSLTPIASANILPLNLSTISFFLLGFHTVCRPQISLSRFSLQPIPSIFPQVALKFQSDRTAEQSYLHLPSREEEELSKYQTANSKASPQGSQNPAHNGHSFFCHQFSKNDTLTKSKSFCSNLSNPHLTSRNKMTHKEWKMSFRYNVLSLKEHLSLYCSAIWVKSAEFQFGSWQLLILFVSSPLFEGLVVFNVIWT